MSVRKELVLEANQLKMCRETNDIFFDRALKTAEHRKRDDERCNSKSHTDHRDDRNKRNESAMAA